MTEALARAMRRLEAESILFAERPSRIDLARLELPNDPLRSARVQIFRNHAIEPILALAGPFAVHARIDFEFALTDYDDSLSFATREPADAYLLHVDLARHASLGDADARARFLESRAAALRVTTSAPIVLVLLGERGAVDAARARLVGVADAHVVGVDELAGTDGPLVDERTAAITGTPIRTSLHAQIARALVASVLPAVLVPPIKAVASTGSRVTSAPTRPRFPDSRSCRVRRSRRSLSPAALPSARNLVRMDRNEIERIVLDVLSAVLRRPFPHGTDVVRESTDGWDSLKHVEIVFAIEEEAGVEFPESMLGELDRVSSFVSAIEALRAA